MGLQIPPVSGYGEEIPPNTDASGLQQAWLGDWWYQLWGTKWAATGCEIHRIKD